MMEIPQSLEAACSNIWPCHGLGRGEGNPQSVHASLEKPVLQATFIMSYPAAVHSPQMSWLPFSQYCLAKQLYKVVNLPVAFAFWRLNKAISLKFFLMLHFPVTLSTWWPNTALQMQLVQVPGGGEGFCPFRSRCFFEDIKRYGC